MRWALASVLFQTGCMAHGAWNFDESERIAQVMAPDVYESAEAAPPPVVMDAAPPLASVPARLESRYELRTFREARRVRVRTSGSKGSLSSLLERQLNPVADRARTKKRPR